MKKFVTAVAVVALVAFAAPVFAATNPFMDVPMNHWAYDAIGQLAAHGILSGYPDGLYKGKQPTTRYEMASALARALAVVDMTKASKQDVEMLQKLVVEFHDELEALGVRVDDIEGKVNLLDSRLGGWKISGELRLDIRNDSINEAPNADGQMSFNRARLRFDRWFGDPENPMHFVGLFDGDAATWKHYYAEIPFFYDTLLTVGKTPDDFEADYYYNGTFAVPGTGHFAGLASTLTDRDIIKFQLEKQLGMGRILGYVAHPDTPVNGMAFDIDKDGAWVNTKNNAVKMGETDTVAGSAWELFLMGKFQFNEQFGFDLGFQGFFGDNAEPAKKTVYDHSNADEKKWTNASLKFNDLWTIFAGLRFNFNENVTFKGIYYHQKAEIDDYLQVGPGWHDALNIDNSSHWAVMLSVKQEALKFTSLWLEYGQYKQGFASPHGLGSIFSVVNATKFEKYLTMLPWDMKYFRVGLGQEWNEKWATHLFYYNYNPDPDGIDKMTEWGLGVRYKYNPNVTFGLNFIQADSGVDGADKDNVVRFRTQVTF